MKDFVELKDYPGYYIAHSPARLMRLKGDVYITCKQTLHSKNDTYWTVTLKTREGKYVKRFMHRLLMQTFVSNLHDKAYVNHIDGNKSNNEISNLEWATPKENAQHAYATGLSSAEGSKKAVHQYYLNGEYITSYDSDVEAERVTGIEKTNISSTALGKRIHAGFYQWSRNLKPNINPVKRKYVESYFHTKELKTFKTINDIADYFGLNNGDKLSFGKIPKRIRNHLIVNYYK